MSTQGAISLEDLFGVLYGRHQKHGGRFSILEAELQDALGLEHTKDDERISEAIFSLMVPVEYKNFIFKSRKVHSVSALLVSQCCRLEGDEGKFFIELDEVALEAIRQSGGHLRVGEHMINCFAKGDTRDKITSFLFSKKRGYVFSSCDLCMTNTEEVEEILSTLVSEGIIRAAIDDIYYLPEYSTFLNQELSVDIPHVAKAYARKFNWTLGITGEEALNRLGLSAQVVGKHIYMSSGPDMKLEIKNSTLEFKHSDPEDIDFAYRESDLIVQALRALGKEGVTESIVSRIRKRINPDIFLKITKDTETARPWISKQIKRICSFSS